MPTSNIRKINYFILKYRFLVLLLMLLVLIIVFPFVEEQYTHYASVMEIFFSLTLIMSIYIASPNRQVLMIAILVAILALIVMSFNLLLGNYRLLVFALSLEIVLFSITTVIILRHVLEYKRVSVDKIYGAICGYLLIGIIWSLIYTIIEMTYPGAFKFSSYINMNIKQGINYVEIYHSYLAHFIYYSYVTLTTLGYGDVTPLMSLARSFSSIEAITGKLYVAVLISRLVGLQISHSRLMRVSKEN